MVCFNRYRQIGDRIIRIIIVVRFYPSETRTWARSKNSYEIFESPIQAYGDIPPQFITGNFFSRCITPGSTEAYEIQMKSQYEFLISSVRNRTDRSSGML